MGTGSRAWASGNWQVRDGEADAFVAAWEAFLAWTRDSQPGFRWARLVRDAGEDHRFRSFAEWADRDAVDAWQADDGFAEHLAACRDLCDDFVGGTFVEAAAVEAG